MELGPGGRGGSLAPQQGPTTCGPACAAQGSRDGRCQHQHHQHRQTGLRQPRGTPTALGVLRLPFPAGAPSGVLTVRLVDTRGGTRSVVPGSLLGRQRIGRHHPGLRARARPARGGFERHPPGPVDEDLGPCVQGPAVDRGRRARPGPGGVSDGHPGRYPQAAGHDGEGRGEVHAVPTALVQEGLHGRVGVVRVRPRGVGSGLVVGERARPEPVAQCRRGLVASRRLPRHVPRGVRDDVGHVRGQLRVGLQLGPVVRGGGVLPLVPVVPQEVVAVRLVVQELPRPRVVPVPPAGQGGGRPCRLGALHPLPASGIPDVGTFRVLRGSDEQCALGQGQPGADQPRDLDDHRLREGLHVLRRQLAADVDELGRPEVQHRGGGLVERIIGLPRPPGELREFGEGEADGVPGADTGEPEGHGARRSHQVLPQGHRDVGDVRGDGRDRDGGGVPDPVAGGGHQHRDTHSDHQDRGCSDRRPPPPRVGGTHPQERTQPHCRSHQELCGSPLAGDGDGDQEDEGGDEAGGDPQVQTHQEEDRDPHPEQAHEDHQVRQRVGDTHRGDALVQLETDPDEHRAWVGEPPLGPPAAGHLLGEDRPGSSQPRQAGTEPGSRAQDTHQCGHRHHGGPGHEGATGPGPGGEDTGQALQRHRPQGRHEE